MLIKKCKNCSKEFKFRGCPTDIKSGRGNFCSVICRRIASRTLPVQFTCENCKKIFPNKYGKFKKFCSKICADRALVGKKSWNAGKKDIYSKETLKLMSLKKLGKPNKFTPFKKGMIPWNKGKGTSNDLKMQIRLLQKTKDWRRAALVRDNFRCIDCGIRNKKLHVHHINQFQYLLKEFQIKTVKDAEKCEAFWDLKNAVTLCKECHKNTHKKYYEVARCLKELVQEGVLEKKEINGISYYRYK